MAPPGSPGSYRASSGVSAIGEAKGLGFAFLVGLGVPEHQAQAFVVFADVLDVEADELATPQHSGKAEEKYCPVSDIDGLGPEARDQGVDYLGPCGSDLPGSDAMNSADS